MKIALIGYGQMGQIVRQVALAKSHEIIAVIDPSHPEATAREINAETLRDADLCIDFTQPKAVLANVRRVASAGKSLVVGTTGWENDRAEVQEIVHSTGIGLLYGANFSIGVHLFFALAAQAARLFDRFPDYDVAALDLHHRHKVDSPSGTGRALANIVVGEMMRKDSVVYDRLDRPLASNELQLSSVRGGSFPGTHALYFDSVHDTIEIRHTARSRTGFAEGAVEAAEWLKGRTGFHTVEDMIREKLGQR